MPHEPTHIALSESQKSQICGTLTVGCDRQTAADYVGCSLADIRHNMEHDPRFVAEVRRAEARCELSYMRCVQEVVANKKEWRAAVWWLERRSPERFARRPDAVTSRQLKMFVTLLIDIIKHDVTNAEDLGRIVAHMQSIAESVDKMLRDAHATEFDAGEFAGVSVDDSDDTAPGSQRQLQLPFEHTGDV
jgi:hypothetical protein